MNPNRPTLRIRNQESDMANLNYRGVAHNGGKSSVETLSQQMRKPALNYRGVAHDGERPLRQTIAPSAAPLIYRGARLA